MEYLGEHLAPGQTLAGGRQQVATVDQIDAVLVDQATLPLVISAPRPADADFYRKIGDAAAKLKRGRHYEINKATGMVSFSSDGLARGAELLRLDSVLSPAVSEPKRYLEDALRAREWYRLGKDYELAGMRVVPRVEPGSRLNDAPRLRNGIIQAIEAKEGLAASPEEAVWARITVSDYFQTYARLSGISGATARSAAEMTTIYGLATAVIPRDGALTRTDHPDLIFESAAARFQAMADDAADRHQAGQAVMVGVPAAADSALVGRLLADRQVAYRALLPGQEEAAPDVMAQAGHTGAVTVLTAEVARGCDVPPAPPAGVAVLAACHSRSARADQWLCGLAGRREEPGESQFFLSLEDPLLRGLRSRLYNAVPARFRRKADAMPLSASQTRIVNELQRNAERASSQRRRACLELEAVEAAQRSQVYSLIEDLVRAPDLRGFVGTLIDEVARIYARRYTDPDRLLSALSMLYHTHIAADDLTTGNPEQCISSDAHAAYARHEQFMGQAAMRQTERKVVFSMINRNWCQQLAELDAMRTAASLESGSLEHLAEYENEAAKRYAVMLEKVKVDIIGYLFHSEPPAG